MKWSFILFLPAVVSMCWALATIAFKRRLTHAQVILSLTQVMVALGITMLIVLFRGRAGSLFIYDFVFEVLAVFCMPMYYIGICSLTEARGATLRQRQVFWLPFLFVIGLTASAYWLGPRRYEEMCHAIVANTDGWIAGDTAWNFLYFWDHHLFPVFTLVMIAVLALISFRKVHLYQRRFNSYYAEDMNVPFIDSRTLSVFTWLFIPLGIIITCLIDFRPYMYKYWLILCAVLLSVLQFLMGRFVFRLDYDARYLAEYIRTKTETK